MDNLGKSEALDILKEKREAAMREKFAARTDSCQVYNLGKQEAFEEAIEVVRKICEKVND